MSRSPWYTWIWTLLWLSSAVVKISERLVGIVVFRSMSLVMMPPLVSMPSDSGVTSRSRTSLTSPFSTPACQRGADGDDLVRVDALVRLTAAGQLLHEVADGRHAGGAADHHDVVDLAQADAGVLDHRLERRLRALEEVGGDPLELGAGERLVQEQRVLLGVLRDVGQVDA